MSTKKQNFAAAFISAAEKTEESPKKAALPAFQTALSTLSGASS